MIKIENTDVYGFEAAIRSCRNPMNSWSKSDSRWHHEDEYTDPVYIIGDNDLGLLKKLVAAGTDHSKFMRMINVTVDITAPLYYLKQLDTYKVGTVSNSCSTMHRITSKEFILDDFSHEHLIDDNEIQSKGILESLIIHLNYCRVKYLETKDKEYWWQMIQLLPSSYNQRRTIQLNYAVLRNIYHSRKDHKLDEWHDFCKWIETLPYSELITK